jgi:2,5-diamino-6-(ribosylamino)-4(3H)-pyrimidinone 5'-phosphate reductase
MIPEIILHNSISLDGSLTNFEVNMGIHYEIAGSYKPQVHLIGSNTIKTGIELYGAAPPEEKYDFKKPKRDDNLPYWVIIDTKGSLKGKLHEVRRFEFCKDVIILISEETPKDYIDYLEKRKYDFHTVGKKHIDLKNSLELLNNKYNVRTILTDCGRILGNILLEKGLVKEISLVIHPVIVGKNAYNMFDEIHNLMNFELKKVGIIENDYILVIYKNKI